MNDLEIKIRTFIINTFLFGQDNNMNNDDSLLNKGIIDSTGILELVGFIENTFNITVEDDEIVPNNLDSITKISTFLHIKGLP